MNLELNKINSQMDSHSLKQLREMEAKDIEKLMKQCGIPVGCAKGDKNQLINKIMLVNNFLGFKLKEEKIPLPDIGEIKLFD